MRAIVVDRDAILEIGPDVYAQLLREGSCELPVGLILEEPNERRKVPASMHTCLAVDGSRSDFWFEFEPEKDLNLLLDWSCLTTYDATTGQLRRTGASSLREELTLRMNAGALNSEDPSPGSSSRTTRADEPRRFAPVKGHQDDYRNFILDSACDTWQQTGTLFGQLARCGCGEDGCSATYAWLTGRTALLVVGISAAAMYTVELGPFPIVDAIRGNM